MCACMCVHAPDRVETALTAWVHSEQSISDSFAGNPVKTSGPVGEGAYAGKACGTLAKAMLLP